MSPHFMQPDFLVHVSDATPAARAIECTRKPTFDRKGALVDRSADVDARTAPRAALVCSVGGCGAPIARDSTSRYCRECDAELAALALGDPLSRRISRETVLVVLLLAAVTAVVVYLTAT